MTSRTLGCAGLAQPTALAAVMLLAARFHIPEVITGGVAAVLIIAAGVHSWLIKRDA